MDRVRFAVVGVGGLGKAHLKSIDSNLRAELVCVCDKAEDIAREMAEEYAVPYYTDYYEMLRVGGFDCVCIITPDQLHREHAVAAMRAGYHVLCEKPLALTNEDCAAIVEASHETGMLCMTGQVCRKSPSFIKAKELIDSGEIGELFFVESEYAHDYEFLKPQWRRDPVDLRHGIIGGGCHAIDLLRWIAGNPTSVIAISNRKVLTDWPVDDCTIAIMRFPRNVIGKVFCGIGVKRKYTMRSCFYGTKGTVICDNKTEIVNLYRHSVSDRGEHDYPMSEIKVSEKHHNVYAEIDDMCKAILDGEPFECDAVEGANTVAIGVAAVESSTLGGKRVAPKYIKRAKSTK